MRMRAMLQVAMVADTNSTNNICFRELRFSRPVPVPKDWAPALGCTGWSSTSGIGAIAGGNRSCDSFSFSDKALLSTFLSEEPQCPQNRRGGKLVCAPLWRDILNRSLMFTFAGSRLLRFMDRHRPTFQLAHQLQHRLFALFRRAGVIHIRPATKILSQPRIDHGVQARVRQAIFELRFFILGCLHCFAPWAAHWSSRVDSVKAISVS